MKGRKPPSTNSILMQPITASQLKEFFTGKVNSETSFQINTAVQDLLTLLGEKSSKFKYLVHTTKLSISESANNQISTSFDALWDEKTDGVITIPIDFSETEKYLITVIFVSI